MKLWKRNAIVVVIVLFVGMAVYLNWSYGQTTTIDEDAAATGKLLGEAALVSGKSPETTGEEMNAVQDDTGNETVKKITSGYFASARLNRQQARDSAMNILQEAAADAMADPDPCGLYPCGGSGGKSGDRKRIFGLYLLHQ